MTESFTADALASEQPEHSMADCIGLASGQTEGLRVCMTVEFI